MAAKKTARKVAPVTAKPDGDKQPKRPKAKLPKQDARFRREIDQRVEGLTHEVRSFLVFQQPHLILAKEWMHDESMPVPTVDLLAYVAHEMLFGHKRIIFAEAAAIAGIDAAFSCFIDLTRNLDDFSLRQTVEHAVARSILLGWAEGENRYHWRLCRWVDFHHEKPIGTLGARRIAQAMTDTLLARAIFSGDWRDIHELAEITKHSQRGERGHKGQVIYEVALLIFKWHPHLEGKLKRPPSRAELKAFIAEVEAEAPSSNDAWNEGFRLLQLPLASPRSIHSNSIDITKLALSARETGPQHPELPTKQEKPAEPGWVSRSRKG